jgi:hypothetical protein
MRLVNGRSNGGISALTISRNWASVVIQYQAFQAQTQVERMTQGGTKRPSRKYKNSTCLAQVNSPRRSPAGCQDPVHPYPLPSRRSALKALVAVVSRCWSIILRLPASSYSTGGSTSSMATRKSPGVYPRSAENAANELYRRLRAISSKAWPASTASHLKLTLPSVAVNQKITANPLPSPGH